MALAAAAAWCALRRRGADRVLWGGAACLLLAGAVALVILEGKPVLNALVLVGFLAAVGAARNAFRVHVALPTASAPRHPVLFYNPLSGGGKAERFHLAEEARVRGIEPVQLRRGDDLEVLVRAEVQRGADGLAMCSGHAAVVSPKL